MAGSRSAMCSLSVIMCSPRGLPCDPSFSPVTGTKNKATIVPFPKQDISVTIVQPLCSEVTWVTGSFQQPRGSIRMNVLQNSGSPTSLLYSLFYLLFPRMTYSASFITETEVCFFCTCWICSKYHENRWHSNSIQTQLSAFCSLPWEPGLSILLISGDFVTDCRKNSWWQSREATSFHWMIMQCSPSYFLWISAQIVSILFLLLEIMALYLQEKQNVRVAIQVLKDEAEICFLLLVILFFTTFLYIF